MARLSLLSFTAAVICAITGAGAALSSEKPAARGTLAAPASSDTPGWQSFPPKGDFGCMLALQPAGLNNGLLSLLALPQGQGFALLILPEGQSPVIAAGVSYTGIWEGGDARISLPLGRFSVTGLRGSITLANDPRMQAAKLLNVPSTLTVTSPEGVTLFRLALPQIDRETLARHLACIRQS
jgi:hypothetical protein